MSEHLHLPNLDTAPPGSNGMWWYVVPETGQRFEATCMGDLLAALHNHYAVAGYPVPTNLPRLVEDAICATVPTYCGGQPRASKEAQLPVRSGALAGLAHTFTNVLAGTRTLASWFVGGRQYASESTIKARSDICAACPQNVEPQGCTACNINTMHEAVRAIVGNRNSDSRLRACKVCGCDLRAKTQLPHAVLWPHMSDAQKAALPAHCWLISERVDELASQARPNITTLSGGVTVVSANMNVSQPQVGSDTEPPTTT